MVLVNGVKYACETCVKGHRSSACKHTERPLFEIKKKGRPVTQCEHCRQLRKTKQVHVKCICEIKDDRGPSKPFDSAAFPNGLPEALDSSVAPMSEGTSSDSDHANNCNCKSGGQCNCCTPRKSAPRVRKKPGSIAPPRANPSDASPPPNILARIAELRPVLPKLAPRELFTDGPLHQPSIGGHPNRHHAHEDHFYSPYGRAYDYTHPISKSQDHLHSIVPAYSTENYAAPQPLDLPYPSPSAEPVQADLWDNLDQEFSSFQDPGNPLCGCCDDCLCPGCSQHSRPGSVSSLTSSPCAHAGVCGGCFSCSLLAATTPPPQDTALSIYQPSDEWIQQFSPSFLDEMMATSNVPLDLPNQEPHEKEQPYISPGSTGSECSNCSQDLCMCDPNLLVCSNISLTASGDRHITTCVRLKGPDAGHNSAMSPYEGLEATNPYLGIPPPELYRSRCSSSSSGSSASQSSVDLISTRTALLPETFPFM